MNDALLFDGHVDLLYTMMRHHPGSSFETLTYGPVTPSSIESGSVRCFASAVYCADMFNGENTAQQHLNTLLNYNKEHIGSLHRLTNAHDLSKLFTLTTGCGYVLLLENADALVDTGTDFLRQHDIRIVGLTHAGTNRIADGNAVRNPKGLTPKGRTLVKKLDCDGFILDTAHLAEPGFRDVEQLFSGPIISSHTGFKKFCNTPRNLAERKLRSLQQRCGVGGLTVNPEMLYHDDHADITAVFRQIDWAVEFAGPETLALGTDFGGYDTVCTGLEDHSRLRGLAEMMLRHGYTAGHVQMLFFDNWRRFYEAHLPPEPAA
jgi:membrane dipeptidase